MHFSTDQRASTQGEHWQPLSLRAKIVVTAATITTLNVTGMVTYSAQHQFVAAEEQGYLIASAAASDAAQAIAMRLALAMGVAQENANTIMGLHTNGYASRQSINALLKSGLQAHPELIGMYTGWERNAFDGKDALYAGRTSLGSNADGRYMPYFEWVNHQVHLTPLVDYEKPGAGDYYLRARASGRPELIDPYRYPVGGQVIMMCSLIQPLFQDGKFVGISGVDIGLSQLQAELAKIKPMGTGSLSLYSTSRQIVSAPEIERIGSMVSPQEVSTEQWKGVMAERPYQFVDNQHFTRFLLPVHVKAFDTRWILDVRIPQETILANAKAVRNGAMMLGALFWILDVSLIGWVLIRQLKPLHEMKRAMECAESDLSSGLASSEMLTYRHDEIGMLARAFESLRERLLDAFTKMEARVSERTREFERANLALRETVEQLERTHARLIEAEKLSALGAMVAGVSHELNTPISNALLAVDSMHTRILELGKQFNDGQLARSGLANYIKENSAASELALRAVLKSAELVASFKQVAIDQTSERRRDFLLHQIMNDTITTLRLRYRNDPWQIELDIAENIAMNSYPGPLEQVITNLVINSIRHGFDGRSQGRVAIVGRLIIPSSGAPSHVSIDVSDDGNGIPSEYLTRVFEPFFTTKLGKGGSGLGLNICHRIVTSLLGGEIRVESSLGICCRFKLNLPLRAPDAI